MGSIVYSGVSSHVFEYIKVMRGKKRRVNLCCSLQSKHSLKNPTCSHLVLHCQTAFAPISKGHSHVWRRQSASTSIQSLVFVHGTVRTVMVELSCVSA